MSDDDAPNTFWVLSLSWMLLAFLGPVPDSRPYIYGVQLIAFLLLIVARRLTWSPPAERANPLFAR